MKIHATIRIRPDRKEADPVELSVNTRTVTGRLEFVFDTLRDVGELQDGDAVVLEITKLENPP